MRSRRTTRTSRRATALVAWGCLAVVAPVLLAACGGGAGSSAPTTSSTTSSTTSTSPTSGDGVTTSAGCAHQPGPSGELTLSVDGRARSVVVHVPSGASEVALPLVLNLHGSGATAVDQDLFSGMDATADADHFYVAYPQGSLASGTGFDWNVPGEPLVGGQSVPAGAANDVTFLTQLVGDLEARDCIDPSRVYATGFSGGARMASQLACDDSTVFAAIAAVSGLRHPTPCPATRAVPVLAFHGTSDPVDPFAGNGEAYWTYSVPHAALLWAQQDQCALTPTTSSPASSVTLTTYSGCAGGASVELYAITGEGHEWPGGPKVPSALSTLLGPQSDAIDADSVMWAFFEAHPLH